MGKETAICLENLSFALGGKEILSEISLEIKKGDFVGLIGPNGAGKTTLLKSINGLRKAQGKIFLLGKNTKGMKEKVLAKQIALMKQDLELNFPFTAREVVLMGRYPHLDWTKQESRRDREITEKFMEYTGTLPLAEKRITQVSGGERQRVMFAKVLTQETPIILLDEPTSNLDLAYQEQLFSYGQEFCRQGGTIVAAIHDLKVAAKYCQKLVLLKKGKIIAQGSPAEVLTSQNLQEAYGVAALVYCNQITGEYDIYLPQLSKNQDGQKIHLIGGGGLATPLLRELYKKGCQLSMGVISQGDSDGESARVFGIPAVFNPPFTPIREEALRANQQLIQSSDWTILCSLPFGQNNLANLQAAGCAKRLLIIEDETIEKRDYTGGKALEVYNQLKKQAVVLPSHQVMDYLMKGGAN